MRKPQLIIAIVMALIGIASYYGNRSQNPVTGEKQSVGGITPDQEVALGLQAAPQMASEFGGLDQDPQLRQFVKQVGQKVVQSSAAAQTPYRYEFHLLADPDTINAFALPGGQIFITRALLSKLENEAQLAGVLGHEVGHVVARHSAEHMAKSRLAGTLAGAAGVAASDGGDPYSAQRSAQMAQVVGSMVLMKHGRSDELESDTLGVRFVSEAGYDPRALTGVMRILEQASGGDSRRPEFASTHPNPGNRTAVIEAEIAKRFPQGVPSNLTLGQTFGS